MKIKFKKIITLLIMIIFCKISFAEEIRVGYSDFNGFIEKTEKGCYKGYGVEYLNKISAYSDLKFKFVSGNFKELMEKLKNKEIDMLCLMVQTEERSKYLEYSRYSFGIPEGRLYTKKSSPIFYRDLKYLNNKKIGLIEASLFKNSVENYEKENKINFKKKYYSSEKETREALDMGEIDIIATEAMSRHNDLKLLDNFPIEKYYFASFKDNDFMKRFNKAQSKVIWLNKNLDLTLYKKYYGNQSGENTLNLTREEFNYIKSNSEILVGIIKSRNILSNYNEKTKEFRGIEPGIVRKINKISGLNLKMIPVSPQSNLMKSLKENKLELLMGVKKESDMEMYDNLLFSVPYINYEFSIVKKRDFYLDKNKEFRVTVPKKLKVLKEYLENSFSEVKIIDSPKGELLDKILENKADVAVIQNYEAQYFLQMPKYLSLVISNYGFYNLDSSFITNRNNKMLVSILNKSINILTNKGEIEKIVNSSISSNIYKLSIYDILNQYQVFIVIILFLIVLIITILFRIIKLNREHLKRTLENNKKLLEANNKLKIATKKAEIASRAKSDFLSQMSHEIRTPLNGILGMARLALENKKIKSEGKNYLTNIEESGFYLLKIINDILDISKIERNKLILNPEVVNMEKFMKNILNILKVRAREKEVNFKIKGLCSKYKYQYFDKIRVQQILVNIIGNAIKYTSSGGNVIFSNKYVIEEGKILCCYEVIDDGVGMSQEFLEHMFKPFEQEKNKLSKYTEGTGLGLSISKNIIDLMGGKIEVKSRLERGTHFIIKIPTTEVLEEDYKKLKNKKENERIYLKGNKNKRILVVEDHPINEIVTRRILENKGYLVESAKNGKEAVEMFSISKLGYYDLILMDIRMPVMDGYEATLTIRSLNRKDAKSVPIVALSANAFDEDRKKSLKYGMDEHLGKPIEINELKKILKKMLNK
ncbi:response regulator [Fusobacterium sp. MFO224]|uniref:response regulator n=1 Tax=Fusobacterium sp. MFO224 TaxID=3378070 RepID=UPI0038548FE1